MNKAASYLLLEDGAEHPKFRCYRRAAPAGFASLLFALLVACEPSYVDADCWLPVLRSDREMRTLLHVGDSEDRSSNSCPMPVPRTFELKRPYGEVQFEWWGSPHKLYIYAKSTDEQPLDIRGDSIEVYENTSGSWLEIYTHRIVFEGHDLLDKPAPEQVAMEIVGRDGQLLDVIRGTYDAVKCTCRVPDYVPQ